MSTDYIDCGSVCTLCWSSDSTQVAASCANGKLMISTLVGRLKQFLYYNFISLMYLNYRSISHQNYHCLITSRKRMIVKDILNETKEHLDFPERVVHINMKYNHLIVTTCSQCFVYQIPNFNTPLIINLKDTSVFLISLTEK